MNDEHLSRHIMVIQRRLDGLKEAIEARDWEAVEYGYDQVDRAIEKLHREAA